MAKFYCLPYKGTISNDPPKGGLFIVISIEVYRGVYASPLIANILRLNLSEPFKLLNLFQILKFRILVKYENLPTGF